ncbi:uncharacterized protein LOC133031023 [Cannabis sativa]|uniref:uncharacterized protein LOC133031023 n=1 Tax=Cannabis sativa TaxID=3483 RepID=UPI0029CA2BD9|nr:uncharacterized protein LOC133031023 [Cannabis sativa]
MVSPYGFMLFDCKALFDELESVSLCLVKRSTNHVALALARAFGLEVEYVFGWNSLPSAQNKVVWNNKHPTVTNVLASAQTAFDHWIKAQDKTSLSSLCLNSIDDDSETWAKLGENTIKINVDAALFYSENKYGFGLVAHYHISNLIASCAGSFGGLYAPEVIEIMGIEEAISWVQANNWQFVEIETDSLVSVQAIQSTHSMRSTFGLLIKDCQILLFALSNVKLSWIKRSANRVAHHVARHSRFYPGCSVSKFSITVEFQHLLHSKC